MKQCKVTVFVKELSIRIRRVKGRNLHVTTTIFFGLSITFFVMILGIFVNNRARKFLSSNEFYDPQLATFNPMSPSPSCSSSSAPSFRDWIAPKELSHSMSDEELMWRASMVPHMVNYPYNRTPKVAFMFLTRGRLPLAPLWEKFFEGHAGFYSIYLHTSSKLNNELPESSVFYKRGIPSKVRNLLYSLPFQNLFCYEKFYPYIRQLVKFYCIEISYNWLLELHVI